ncbi:MAG TPA: alpha/beta hydrolase [Bradyrhizobium sp.]|jgi:dienelactone hydrolase|nr:alpha/beta hydrolase [Bradyrhizobium sp.]
MVARRLAFVALALLLLAAPAAAADHLVDGVPLPSDAALATAPPATAVQRQWRGVWVGAWGGTLRHILLVEEVAADGAARVVYAVGGRSPGMQGRWLRLEGKASEQLLEVQGKSFAATYRLTGGGRLKARYQGPGGVGTASMARADFSALMKPDAAVEWMRGKSELLETGLIEQGRPVRLEAVMFRPEGAGPFPLAVINHGSTGMGLDPRLARQTWVAADLADFLNERGWLVAFPQRRGRGKSDGLYDEGFSEDRKSGYTCDADISLRGANRALDDIDAAIAALRRRPDVAPAPLLIGGQSRGGVLAVAWAGLHAEQISGVINLVGGWLGDACSSAGAVNRTLFERGAHYGRPTIWLYGAGDPFYSIAHSRANFAAFEKAGGHGSFLEFGGSPNPGHDVVGNPDLWSGPVGTYLDALARAEEH